VSTLAEDRFLTDELWERLAPLIPPRKPAINGRTGQPRIPDRRTFAGIVFVLLTGIPWMKLPGELGYGSGITCWRRLREWQDAGVWDQLRKIVLDELGQAGMIDWSRTCLDSVSVRAKKGDLSLDPTQRIGGRLAPSTTS
jgi:transposase